MHQVASIATIGRTISCWLSFRTFAHAVRQCYTVQLKQITYADVGCCQSACALAAEHTKRLIATHNSAYVLLSRKNAGTHLDEPVCLPNRIFDNPLVRSYYSAQIF
jgi:hypothetical protein